MRTLLRSLLYTFACVGAVALLAGARGNTAVADTSVSGYISADTTWTAANSPYSVTGNVVVRSGATLTIEPGVTVNFNADKSLQIDGAMIAKGTSASPITFTGGNDASTGAKSKWAYILFSDSSTDAAYNSTTGDYTSGSILEYCTVEYAGGTSVSDNGAIRLNNAHPLINYCTIKNNSAPGIYAYNISSTLKITNSTITDNKGSNGAGVYARSSGGVTTISGNTIKNNTATSQGGGIYSYGGTVTLTNNTISSNTASFGGGIFTSYGTVTLTNNTISSNIAPSGGGGIYSSSTMTLTNNTISGNTASTSSGGGIYSSSTSSTMTLTNNTISSNTASSGGGIHTDYGTLTLTNNTISSNTASSGNGGGIYTSYGTVTLTNNTISSNTTSAGSGGGIYSTGTLTLTKNTISNNTALDVAAVFYSGGSDGKNFQYNTITGNKTTGSGYANVYVNAYPLINYNNIYDNTATYELSFGKSQGSKNLDAKNNWWGTSDETAIQDKIYDGMDSSTKALVDYYPYSTALRTDTGSTGTTTTTTPTPTVTASPSLTPVASPTSSATPKASPTPSPTPTPAASLSAVTGSATNVTATSATLTGTVNARGLSTSAWFEYGIAKGTYGYKTTSETVTGSNDTTVSINVTGLTAGTTYYYRIAAQNNSGTSYGGEMSFQYSAPGSAPTVTTESATDVTSTTATLNGTVNANGISTTAWFEYGALSGSYSTKTTTKNVTGSTDTKLSDSISNLTAGTTYYYRAVAQNSAGTSYGKEMSFYYSSNQKAPAVTTDLATEVTETSAKLNGEVNPNELSTIAWFEYGTQKGTYKYKTDTQSLSGSSYTKVNATITGLTAGTTYYYRLAARNSVGTSYGSEMEFYKSPGVITPPTPVSSPTPVTIPSPTVSPTPKPSPTTTPANTGTVFGYVLDEDDNPLRGVMVSIAGAGYSSSATTDADGYYELSGLAAGGYTLTYTKSGYTTQSQDISLAEDEAYNMGSVVMEAAQKGSIYGYVVDIKGNPVESAKLKLRNVKTKATKSTATDQDGAFEFTDLEAGTYTILATKKRYKNAQTTVKLEEAEDKEIEMVMRKTTSRMKEEVGQE